MADQEISEIVIVLSANIPLAKFKFRNTAVDLIFAEFLSPVPGAIVSNYFL